MEYSYYPGCSLKGTAQEYAQSIEKVSEKLGIKLIELPEWSCCGASPTHVPDQRLNLAIPALTLKEANKYERDVVVACAACYNRLRTTGMFLEKNIKNKEEIEKIVEGSISGKSKVRHFLEILVQDIKPELLASSIKKPLKDLKVACYYGCLLSRPDNVMPGEKTEAPEIMDNLMKTLGAIPVEWHYKTECCGTAFGVSKPEVVLKLSGKILKAARNAGAECIVVACPLCQTNIDLRQNDIGKYCNDKFDFPIFYFSELSAIALGVNYQNLRFDKHIVDPVPLLTKKGLI